MFNTFMAALKAIPAIVEGLKEIKSSIRYLQDVKANKELAEVKEVLRVELEAIKKTEDRNEILKRIHAINSRISD